MTLDGQVRATRVAGLKHNHDATDPRKPRHRWRRPTCKTITVAPHPHYMQHAHTYIHSRINSSLILTAPITEIGSDSRRAMGRPDNIRFSMFHHAALGRGGGAVLRRAPLLSYHRNETHRNTPCRETMGWGAHFAAITSSAPSCWARRAAGTSFCDLVQTCTDAPSLRHATALTADTPLIAAAAAYLRSCLASTRPASTYSPCCARPHLPSQ